MVLVSDFPAFVFAFTAFVQDHAGGDFYRPQSNCGWRVDGSAPMSVYFTEFQLFTRCPFGADRITTACTDTLTVFDGPDTNSPVLGTVCFHNFHAPYIYFTEFQLFTRFFILFFPFAFRFGLLVSFTRAVWRL